MFQLPDPPPNSGSSLHNIVTNNFESGPLDTFPDFDFTSEQILSFVNLNSPRLQSNETNGFLPSFEEPENVTETRGHDLVSWLQVNHADNSPTVSSGSQQIPGSNTASAPLIEPVRLKICLYIKKSQRDAFSSTAIYITGLWSC